MFAPAVFRRPPIGRLAIVFANIAAQAAARVSKRKIALLSFSLLLSRRWNGACELMAINILGSLGPSCQREQRTVDRVDTELYFIPVSARRIKRRILATEDYIWYNIDRTTWYNREQSAIWNLFYKAVNLKNYFTLTSRIYKSVWLCT